MKEPVWVPRQVLLDLHSASLRRYGGASGLRDEGLFDAALSRAQQVFAYGEGSDLFDLAAAYAGGFVRNHPFVDGNKRAAFAATLLFLAANGWRLNVAQGDATHKVLGLAAREIAENEFASWLRANSAPA